MSQQTVSISLPHDWAARPYQFGLFRALLMEKKRRAVCVWHRRAGKDSCSINLIALMSQQRVGTYWHCLPSFQQGRRVVWEGIDKSGRRIIKQAFPDAIVDTINETNMTIKLKNGSVYQVVGSDNFDALVGTNPVGVVFSEYSLADPRAWDYVRPILAENGGFAVFIYTPRGKNHGYTLYNMARKNPEWFCELLSIHDTQAIPLSVIDEERESGMPDEMLRQEFECDFSAQVAGSFYGDLITKLREDDSITDFLHPTDNISTHWDLGISDSTAIWFWRTAADGTPEVIDYYEAHGLPISHYVTMLAHKGYQYLRHWLPHDAQARSLATGMSIMEQLRDQGLPIAVSPRLSLMDGIQAARAVLQQPIRFHKTRCQKGLDALEAYKREYDEESKTFKQKPLHDFSSHGADAFRYLAMSLRSATRMNKAYITGVAQSASEIRRYPTTAEMTLDQLHEDAPSRASMRI